MQKAVLSSRQAFFVSIPLLVIMGHFFLVPLYLRFAGRDAWLGVIAGFFAGAVIFLAMGNLHRLMEGKTLVEKLSQWLGPWVGKVLAVPLVLYFFALSLVTLYGFSIFISSIFLSDHPRWIITVTFTLAMMYMVHKGVEVIARVSEWIILYNMVSGMLVSLALHREKHYEKLLPILQHGPKPLLPVIVLILAVFGELLVMLMVQVQGEQISGTNRKAYLMLFLSCFFIFPSTTAGPVAIFGEDQAKLLAFPVESTVRLISVGFIERFDLYGLTIMTVSALLRLALLHYGASVAVAQVLNLKSYRWVNPAMAIPLGISGLMVFDNYLELMDFLRRYYPYGAAACGLICLLWITAWLASRRRTKPTTA